MTAHPDPVAGWEALRGSTDTDAIIRAGTELAKTVKQARDAWVKRGVDLEEQLGEMQSACERIEEQGRATARALVEAVHAAHDAEEHEDGWAVCAHRACRAVVELSIEGALA